MEEVKEGMSTFKKTLLGVITTAVTGAGAYVTTHINEIFGIEDETEAKVEQLLEAQQTQQASTTLFALFYVELLLMICKLLVECHIV